MMDSPLDGKSEQMLVIVMAGRLVKKLEAWKGNQTERMKDEKKEQRLENVMA
jgi:hypothetical protein